MTFNVLAISYNVTFFKMHATVLYKHCYTHVIHTFTHTFTRNIHKITISRTYSKDNKYIMHSHDVHDVIKYVFLVA